MSLLPTILKLKERRDIRPEEIGGAIESIVTGRETDGEIKDFLLALREKGETAEEIASAAKGMRRHAVGLSRPHPDLLDTCGTGGDGLKTFNVSTLSALVACACGAKVAKHGNRSVSSVCGSADLMEMLGVRIDLPPSALERCLEQTGFAFFFAPAFHPATRYAMPARKQIQGKTLFNLLGPLVNPAGASYQILGVYEVKWVEKMAHVLKLLGSRRALVVHGLDGLDEISICAKTKAAELSAGRLRVYEIDPATFGAGHFTLEDLRCESKEEAKKMALEVLRANAPAAMLRVVSVNAGAALYVAGKAGSLSEGARLAEAAILKGRAMKKLEEITAFCRTL